MTPAQTSGPVPSLTRWMLILGVVQALTGLGGLQAQAQTIAQTQTQTQSAGDRGLRYALVEEVRGDDSLTSLDGVVEAVRQTALSTQVPGAVTRLDVRAGDRVRAGQELARIDARTAQQNLEGAAAQVEVARANLQVAAKELERQRQLFDRQYISQSALDRVQAQHDAARAQLAALEAQNRAAQAQTQHFVVSAPYDGVVSDVHITLGDMAMPGRPLVTIHDPAVLRVSVAVPQSLSGVVQARPASLRFELPGHPTLGGLREPVSVQILPVVDAATHTMQVRLNLPRALGSTAPGVVPGMFARAWLPVSGPGLERTRLFVPSSAIVRRAEVAAVYVLDHENRPRLRQVRPGPTAGERTEILTGLAAGERVAIEPQAAARQR